jgi:hypothetical protein
MKRLSPAALLMTMLSGCSASPEKFNAATPETAKKSIESMSEGMTAVEKRAFASDVAAVMVADGLGNAPANPFRKGKDKDAAAQPKPDPSEAYKALQGLTVAEIRGKAVEARARFEAAQAKSKAAAAKPR